MAGLELGREDGDFRRQFAVLRGGFRAIVREKNQIEEGTRVLERGRSSPKPTNVRGVFLIVRTTVENCCGPLATLYRCG